MTKAQISFSCGDLVILPLTGRRDRILGDAVLCSMLARAIESQGLQPNQVTVGELAYALGDLLPQLLSADLPPLPIPTVSVDELRPCRQPFSSLVRGLQLGDLALSVAMEQRTSWRDPDAPPKDLAAARWLFGEVCERSKPVLEAVLRRRFGRNPRVFVEDCLQDTWMSACESYWSRNAKSRFEARTSINGLLISIATLRALGQIRHQKRRSTMPLTQDDEAVLISGNESSISDSDLAETIRGMLRGTIQLSRGFQPDPGVLGGLLERHGELPALEETLEDFAKTEARFARQYHIEGRKNCEIGELYGCSAPYVTGVLKTAWRRMGKSQALLDALARIERGDPPPPTVEATGQPWARTNLIHGPARVPAVVRGAGRTGGRPRRFPAPHSMPSRH